MSSAALDKPLDASAQTHGASTKRRLKDLGGLIIGESLYEEWVKDTHGEGIWNPPFKGKAPSGKLPKQIGMEDDLRHEKSCNSLIEIKIPTAKSVLKKTVIRKIARPMRFKCDRDSKETAG